MNKELFDEMFEGLLQEFDENQIWELVDLYDAAYKMDLCAFDCRADFKKKLAEVHRLLNIASPHFEPQPPALPSIEMVDYVPEEILALQRFGTSIFVQVECYLREIGLHVY